MAKKKAAAKPAKPEEEPVGGAEGKTETKPKKGKKADGPAKPPANPFGNLLPRADEQGSPADGNWKPKGDPDTDVATLEAQERYLYRLMVRSKAERDMAKAEAKLILCQAEETSVTDGFPVEEKKVLHRKADTAERKAAKADKEYKRSRDGWNSVKGMLHRYLTEPDPPLFAGGKKSKAA